MITYFLTIVQKIFTKSFFQTAAVIGMAVVLLIAVLSAIGKGKLQAQSQAIIASAESLRSGFEKFYADQDRYPTANEFSDEAAMKNYFIPFPAPKFVSNQCPNSFSYKRPEPGRYQLSFCLPASQGQYKQGWNTVDYTHK